MFDSRTKFNMCSKSGKSLSMFENIYISRPFPAYLLENSFINIINVPMLLLLFPGE